MGTAWAVGAAAALASSTALLALGLDAGPQPDAEHPVQLVLAALVVATWAYGISVAAHGSRGALVALLVYALVWAALPGGVVLGDCARDGGASCAPLTWAVAGADLLVGVLAGYAAAAETLQRRGVVHKGVAFTLLLPLLALALVAAAQALS